MPLAKQFVPVVPSGVDQRTEPALLPPGKLVEAINVRQPTPGLLQKRNGYGLIDINNDQGGVIASGRSIASTGTALVERTKDAVWIRSDGMAKWVKKATAQTVAVKPTPQAILYGYKPSEIVSADGKFRYAFAGDVGQNTIAEVSWLQVGNGGVIYNRPSWWYYRITDVATGAEIVGATKIPTVVGWQAKPVVAGGFVWLFVGADLAGGANRRYLYAIKFDPANPETAPVVTTYYDAGAPAGPEIDGWDVRTTPSGTVVVAVVGAQCAKTGGGTADGVVSFLNTATGLPQVSPGNVGVTIGALSGAEAAASWLEDEADPSPAAYYLAIASSNLAVPKILTLATNNLATTATTSLAGYGAKSIISGYRETSSSKFVTISSNPGTTPESDTLTLVRHDVGGATTGFTLLQQGLVLASKPFRLTGGTSWYVLAQHDDNLAHLQGAYYLIDLASGKILGRTLYGQGGDAGQRATLTAGANNYGWLTPVVVDSTTATAAVASWTGEQYVTREISFIIDDTGSGTWGGLGPMVRGADGQLIAVPGAWPLQVTGTAVAEFLPMYPRVAPAVASVANPLGGAGLPTGTYTCYYVYVLRDATGNTHRSRPSPAGTVVIGGAGQCIQWTINTLRVTNSATGDYGIELYVTTAGNTTPFLQYAIPNDPTVTAVQFTMVQTTIITDVTLYTYGGAELANDPAPPFAVAAVWKDRLFLADTDDAGVVWVSKEKQEGVGYSFSADLTLKLSEGSPRVRAMGAVDLNYFALLKEDGIWILSGDGPDPLGHGMYQPFKLPGDIGCTNPSSTCTTPAGLVFQGTSKAASGANDGGIYLLTRSLQLVYLGAGVEKYRGQTISAAVFIPEENQVRLFIAGASEPATVAVALPAAMGQPMVTTTCIAPYERPQAVQFGNFVGNTGGGPTVKARTFDPASATAFDLPDVPSITDYFTLYNGLSPDAAWPLGTPPYAKLADCSILLNVTGTSLRRLDPQSRAWSTVTLSALSAGQWYPLGLSDGTVLFYATIWGFSPDAYLYNPSTGALTGVTYSGAAVQSPFQAGIVLEDGTALMFGVRVGTNGLDAFRYDGTHIVLDKGGPVISPATIQTAVLLGNRRVLLICSANGNGLAYVYDANAKTFTQTGNISGAIANRFGYAVAGSLAGEAYLVGGSTTGPVLTNRIEKYDAGSNTWSLFTTMPSALRYCAALVVPKDASNSVLYVFGGQNSGGVLQNGVQTFNVTAQSLACGCSAPIGTSLVLDLRNPVPGAQDPAGAVGQWYVDALPAAARGACVHNGVCHWVHYLGTLRYEVPSQWFDDTVIPILTRVHFAPWSLAQLQGSQRIYRVQAAGKFLGNCSLKLTAYIVQGDATAPFTWTKTITLSGTGLHEFGFRPSPSNGTSQELIVEEVSSASLTAGWALRSVGLEVGVDGLRRLNTSQNVG
ncbi:MAG TPA: kelch repeat-containing protein [Gaiellales bacterium]|nr:kelch repeat-containing protein [Gaiellales bacterium]